MFPLLTIVNLLLLPIIPFSIAICNLDFSVFLDHAKYSFAVDYHITMGGDTVKSHKKKLTKFSFGPKNTSKQNENYTNFWKVLVQPSFLKNKQVYILNITPNFLVWKPESVILIFDRSKVCFPWLIPLSCFLLAKVPQWLKTSISIFRATQMETLY